MLRFVLPFSLLFACACGGGGAEGAPASENDSGEASVTGAVGDLVFGPSTHAIGGTFYGADDGLFVLVTDARNPCGTGAEGRQPNTSVLLLQFLDGSTNSPTSAPAGDYTFAAEPFGAGLWFRVSRAYRLDGTCTPTVPSGFLAVAGTGALDDVVSLPGGRAAGSFSADFAEGSLSGTFSAPFCNAPVLVDFPRAGEETCLD